MFQCIEINGSTPEELSHFSKSSLDVAPAFALPLYDVRNSGRHDAAEIEKCRRVKFVMADGVSADQEVNAFISKASYVVFER